MWDHSRTTTTFVQKLKAAHPETWERFRNIYAPLIYALAKQYSKTEADARQITGNVIEVTMASIERFEPQQGKRFRNYVKTICFRQISDFHRQRERAAKKLDASLFDKRFSEFELRRAIAITKQQGRHSDANWKLFRLRFEDKLSIAQIADRQAIKPATAQKAIRRLVLAVQQVLNDNRG